MFPFLCTFCSLETHCILLFERYVGALPLALGVRSTNVYEDRSIALYDEEIDDEEPEPSVFIRQGMPKGKVWGEYTV